MTRTRSTKVAALAALTIGLAACGGDGDEDRQADVAERGAEVMPFDLDATTHQFKPTDNGLTETVVADDPTDSEQVELVQQHLTEEAERFEDGDYSDPAAIHGEDMPGLAALQEGAGKIDVELDLPDDGARLTFSTDDPALVAALHEWGEAQSSDHGTHAEPTAD